MSDRIKLTIPRSQWLRGEGGSSSWLLRPSDGKLCCLGHALRACGRTDDELRLIKTPNTGFRYNSETGKDVNSCTPPGTGTPLERHQPVAESLMTLMHVNDHGDMVPDERERLIAEGLGKYGFDVEFVD